MKVLIISAGGKAVRIAHDLYRLGYDICGFVSEDERTPVKADRNQVLGTVEDIPVLMEKENVAGAYYCSYPSFVDVYHVFSRMVERTGLSVFIMLCTLNYENREVTEEEEQKMSAVLCESIQESIRKGDFYTKYNSRQYLVMLIEIEQESCQKVSKRINKQFMSKMGQKRSLKVNYYVASVGEVCQNTEKKSDIFE